MTEDQFQRISTLIRDRLHQESSRTGDFGNDIFVHGSRANQTAAIDADLDIGIRVSTEKFEQLIQERLNRVNEGSDKWETLQEAARRGRLHAGEAGISGIRKEIQRLINDAMNLNFAKGVQITVIREAGPFDQGPFISLRESEMRG
jgi:predicted nucleotidyltransferase